MPMPFSKNLIAAGILIACFGAPAAAQAPVDPSGGESVTFFQRVAVDPSEIDAPQVGITDIVQRQAIGIVEDLTRTLQITDEIFFNETIETGPDSATRVTFLDETSLSLGESSQVVIDRFVYDPDRSTGEMAMSLSTGVFRFASGAIDDSNYGVETPNATIGIRGTIFFLRVQCGRLRPDDCLLEAETNEGLIEVSLPNGSTYPVPVGTRLRFDPTQSSEPELIPVTPGTPPLPGVAEMIARLNQATLDQLNENLPPGTTVANATVEQLTQAATSMTAANFRIGDLIIEALQQVRPDAVRAVAQGIIAATPQATGRVIQALNLSPEDLDEFEPGAPLPRGLQRLGPFDQGLNGGGGIPGGGSGGSGSVSGQQQAAGPGAVPSFFLGSRGGGVTSGGFGGGGLDLGDIFSNGSNNGRGGINGNESSPD